MVWKLFTILKQKLGIPIAVTGVATGLLIAKNPLLSPTLITKREKDNSPEILKFNKIPYKKHHKD